MKLNRTSSTKKSIKIEPTGWANIKDYIMVKEGEFIVPYSSHSNYEEIDTFVNSLRPAIIKCIVREKNSNYRKSNNITSFQSYMFTLQRIKQNGYEALVKKYSDISRLSQEYRKMMQPGVMQNLSSRLGIIKTNLQKSNEDSRSFSNQFSQIIKAKNKNVLYKGAKIKRPEENENLTKEDVEFIRNSLSSNSFQTIKDYSSKLANSERNSFKDEDFDEDLFFKQMTKVKISSPEDNHEIKPQSSSQNSIENNKEFKTPSSSFTFCKPLNFDRRLTK